MLPAIAYLKPAGAYAFDSIVTRRVLKGRILAGAFRLRLPAFAFPLRQGMLAGNLCLRLGRMDTNEQIAFSRHVNADKRAVDTPSLMVDLDALEANIARIAAACRQNGINWRPHIKGIKVPQIARKLIDAGAIGITCAKLGEAEVMAAHGFSDILIANQIVGPQKIARLVALRASADVMAAVVSRDNVAAIAAAALAAGVIIRLVIEVNMGMNRAGVEPGEDCVAFARFIAAQQGVRFAGLMGWEGQTAAIPDRDAKAEAV